MIEILHKFVLGQFMIMASFHSKSHQYPSCDDDHKTAFIHGLDR